MFGQDGGGRRRPPQQKRRALGIGHNPRSEVEHAPADDLHCIALREDLAP
jgi:hypothetical protein